MLYVTTSICKAILWYLCCSLWKSKSLKVIHEIQIDKGCIMFYISVFHVEGFQLREVVFLVSHTRDALQVLIVQLDILGSYNLHLLGIEIRFQER